MLCGPSRALCHIFKSSEVETFLALALTLYRFGQSACLMSAVSMSNAEQDATHRVDYESPGRPRPTSGASTNRSHPSFLVFKAHIFPCPRPVDVLPMLTRSLLLVGRAGTPEDIAGMVIFLSSQASAHHGWRRKYRATEP